MSIGVDYTLPALGGGFGEGYKIAAGYDFVGQEDTTGTLPSKNDSDPMMTCGTWIGCKENVTKLNKRLTRFKRSWYSYSWYHCG